MAERHVQEVLSHDLQGSLKMSVLAAGNVHEAEKIIRASYHHGTLRSEWRAQLKNLVAGVYTPLVTRGVFFGDRDTSRPSFGVTYINCPAVIVDEQRGTRHWGWVHQGNTTSHSELYAWQLRDIITTKYTPACITVVAVSDGAVLWQNAASMAMLGETGN